MGNKKSKLTFKEIENELKKKLLENTVLFVGLPKSGKSTIISNIAKHISKCAKNEFIECSYELKSFTITEYTDKNIKNHSSKSYKHLNIVHQFAPLYKTTKRQFETIVAINQMKEKNKKLHELRSIDGNIINYKLLLYGYIRQTQHSKNIYLNTSEDIINLIKSFIKLFITSHKIKCKFSNKIYNLLDLSYVNGNDLKMWKELFQYINTLVFVCDISQYNVFSDYQKHINKLIASINIFESLMNDKQLHGVKTNVILNKLDIFKQKMEIKKISLTKCPLFQSDYDDFDAALNAIRNTFASVISADTDISTIDFFTVIGVDEKSIQNVWNDLISHKI
eukprot:521288_1